MDHHGNLNITTGLSINREEKKLKRSGILFQMTRMYLSHTDLHMESWTRILRVKNVDARNSW